MSGGDQSRAMSEWIKQVRKAGYIVDEHQMIYKIRDPETGGLIMTAPMFPKGQFVVANTQSMARKKGVTLTQEVKRTPNGEAPPPTFSDPPPEHVEMAARMERERAEREAREQEEAMAKAKHHGRPPATPAQIEETKQLGRKLDAAVREMFGGRTDENLLRIWRDGQKIAERNDTWYPGNRSGEPEVRALKHMNALINGDYHALNSNQAEFWRVTLAEHEKLADRVGEASGEVLVPPPVTDAIKELRAAHQEALAAKGKEIAELKLALSKTTSELERTKAQLDKKAEQLANANQQYEELDREYGAMLKEQEAATAKSNGPVADELSVAVLRRMLLVRFPDAEKEITEAIEFAAEVAKRT